MKWTKDYVKEAAKDNRIIAGFNVFGHEDAMAIIKAAERAESPVILMVNRDARRDLEIEHWGSLLGSMAEAAKVPVGVHLDHSSDPESVKRAINAGFSSVMFDGSKLPLEENIRLTAELAELAHAKGIYLEGELGAVPYDDMGETNIQLTSVDEAKQMEDNTDIDWLAISVGNIHRLVGRFAPIHFDVLEEIQNGCELPFVIHGSSGITPEDMQKLKLERIGKMNLGTSLRKTFGDTLRAEMEARPEEFDRQKLMAKSVVAVEEKAYQILTSLL